MRGSGSSATRDSGNSACEVEVVVQREIVVKVHEREVELVVQRDTQPAQSSTSSGSNQSFMAGFIEQVTQNSVMR